MFWNLLTDGGRFVGRLYLSSLRYAKLSYFYMDLSHTDINSI